MKQRIEIAAELKEIDPAMAQWPFHMPYSVPDGYFNQLTEKILEQAATELLVAKQELYTVPANYFNQLPDTILAAIRKQEVEEELETMAPVLNRVTKQMPYTRTSLPELNIEAMLEQAKIHETPVVRMPALKTRKWLQYAAAAIATGIILLTAFLYNGNKNEVIDPTTLASYVQMDVSHEMTRLSEEELNTYLATSEKLVVTTGEHEQYGEDELPDVNEHIELMSDDELKQYLDESTESSTEAKADTNS